MSISQPQPLPCIRWHLGPIVTNFDYKRFATTFRHELNETRTYMGRNTVPNRVFDQGLQDQAGNFRIQRLRIDLEDHFQAIAKANSFNLQVRVEKIEFAL